MDKVGLYMHNIKGLEELHKHAADEHQWEETIECMLSLDRPLLLQLMLHHSLSS